MWTKISKIWCCACDKKIKPRLTTGKEVYPHRRDLKALPFWICDSCNNFVGCHHKRKDRTTPLGCIATLEVRKARQHLHAFMDPVWKEGAISRKDLYAHISEKIGWKYHTGGIRSQYEASTIHKIIKDLIYEEPKG